MYYLTYRPQTLDEIDNSHVRDIIRQILNAENVPHAFLFVGQKGTGKTSVARIVARSLNKLTEQDISPDIVEMDAASNRGIEEVKSLIKEASYLPMTGAFRIFIIDEAHMITTEAYNALLKTLEEPPATAVFILATTNLEKVPKTIVSRCSVVNFGKAKDEDVVTMLSRIALREKIPTSPELFQLIARHADGSFRDAAKILEDLVIQKKLSVGDAKQHLGIVGTKNLIEVIDGSSLPQALAWIQRFTQEGGSIKNLIETTLHDLHTLMLQHHGIKTDTEKIVSKLTASEVVLLIKHLTEAYRTLSFTPIESLTLEIAIAEFYNERHV